MVLEEAAVEKIKVLYYLPPFLLDFLAIRYSFSLTQSPHSDMLFSTCPKDMDPLNHGWKHTNQFSILNPTHVPQASQDGTHITEPCEKFRYSLCDTK